MTANIRTGTQGVAPAKMHELVQMPEEEVESYRIE